MLNSLEETDKDALVISIDEQHDCGSVSEFLACLFFCPDRKPISFENFAQ